MNGPSQGPMSGGEVRESTRGRLWRAVLGAGKAACTLTEVGSLWGVLKQKSELSFKKDFYSFHHCYS